MMHARSLRRLTAVALGGLAVGIAAGIVGERARQALTPASRAPSAGEIRAEYDASVARIKGWLSRAALAGLDSGPGDSVATVVVLRGRDLPGCEDLGRQLRELQHRYRGRASVFVWTLASDSNAVLRFLRRERLRAGLASFSTLDSLGLGPAPLVTPAVLRVRLSDGSTYGIGHARRFRNVRSRSFADELPEPGPPRS
ncbi:MAG TPA: hypothetical protein VFQ45_05310 [Longimicrobium sp.]|nr:hypothetical protein [Longimicrobium sp.]